MRNATSLRRAMFFLVLSTFSPLTVFAQRACDERPLVPVPSGGWTSPLDTRVSLHVRDVSLRDALDHLTAVSKVQLAYSADFLPVDQRVCLSAESEPLGTLLATLLRGTTVQVLVVSGRIVLSPGATPAPLTEPTARSVSVLERVVVTGNAVAAPRRPLVIGVEVIDGEQLRRQSLGNMAEMLNASVAGVWSWSQSPSSLVAQYGGIRGASSFGSSAPKIYIDGVEVANPLLMTQLNPDVVDHVEVIRGPQGSALYGSDAISGVINVLTRHDGAAFSAPSVSVRSTAGAAGSAFASGLVPTHEQRINVRAGTNVKSAGLALAFGQTGALFPSSETRTLAATSDARLVTSGETLTMSARLFDKRSGMGENPILSGLLPVVPPTGGGGGSAQPLASASDLTQSVRQYTLSTSAAFASEGAWTHSILAGLDGYYLDHVADATSPILSTAVDSALRAARGYGDRYTLRENSVAHFNADGDAQGTLTLGIEHSVLRQGATVTTQVPGAFGEFPTAVQAIHETWNHNTGLISQLSMSWSDAIFLTGGLRLERNDAFSGTNRYPLLPMLGLAVVNNVGDVEVKWRAAYGKGIRPPQVPARSAASGYTGNQGYATSYGSSAGIGGVLPALDPEVQSGYEGGLELYFGRALTLQLTRFDQRVTGLIQNVSIAVDTFAHGGTIERRVRYQLQNVGEITNTGWEFQGNLTQGAFTLTSALSAVDSRVRALANGYMGDLQPGDRMLAVPAKTGSVTLAYVGDKWYASVGATRAMDWINYDRYNLAKTFAETNGTTAKDKDLTGSNLRAFWRTYDGDTHLRLTGSRDLARGVSLLFTGDNLLGGQLGEPDNVTIRPGRTVTAGLRASF
ncbi:MAG: TonB-dependent receptor [bacterium]